jgi:hypothetical protein
MRERETAMNKLTQLLTMTGMGALAALAIGVTPAQAAGTSTATPAKPSAGQTQQHFGWERTVGYYRSGRACEVAGRIGERFGRWDDYDCDFVRFGFRRGTWALQVSDGFRGHGFPGHGFPGHGFPGHGFPGHGFPGHGGPHFPGHGGPHFPGHGGPGFPHFPGRN